jgi:hypothetical protein
VLIAGDERLTLKIHARPSLSTREAGHMAPLFFKEPNRTLCCIDDDSLHRTLGSFHAKPRLPAGFNGSVFELWCDLLSARCISRCSRECRVGDRFGGTGSATSQSPRTGMTTMGSKNPDSSAGWRDAVESP